MMEVPRHRLESISRFTNLAKRYLMLTCKSNARRHHLSVDKPVFSSFNQDRPLAASPQEHANPFQYQISHGGGCQIHNQQVDPDGKPVISTPPKKTVNAPANVDLEAGEAVSISITSSPPSQSKTPPVDDENDYNGVNKTPPNDDHKGKYEFEKAFMLGGQIISTTAAVSAKAGKSEISSEAEYLWYFLLACIFTSLTFFSYGLFLSRYGRLRKIVRVVRATGNVATGFAIVTAAGLQLPNELMVWGTLGICALCAPAIFGFAMKY